MKKQFPPFHSLARLAGAIGGIIAPPRCMDCMREGSWYCANCRSKYLAPHLVCVLCGEEQQRGLTCRLCRQQTPLAGALYVASYKAAWVRRGIGWLKYKGVRAVNEALGSLLAERLGAIGPVEELARNTILVPIPLHPRKERQRGFNQSFLLSQVISNLTGIPTIPLLRRGRQTHTQAALPHDMRANNVAGAFTLTGEPGAHRRLIVLDDVTTTGSTLSEAARVLRAHSMGEIWGATIARG